MAEDKKAFIQFVPGDGKDKKTEIRFGFHAMKRKSNNYIDYYIPSFNIFFSAPNEEIGSKRAATMVKSFFDFYFKQRKHRDLFLEIHKLGFRAKNHTSTLKSLLDNKKIKAKFNSHLSEIPNEFNGLDSEDVELSMAV